MTADAGRESWKRSFVATLRASSEMMSKALLTKTFFASSVLVRAKVALRFMGALSFIPIGVVSVSRFAGTDLNIF